MYVAVGHMFKQGVVDPQVGMVIVVDKHVVSRDQSHIDQLHLRLALKFGLA